MGSSKRIVGPGRQKLRAILNYCFSSKELSSVLKKVGLKSSGTKSEKLSRVLDGINEGTIVFKDDLVNFHGKEDLVCFCQELGLKDRGIKKDLRSRICDWFENEYSISVRSSGKQKRSPLPIPSSPVLTQEKIHRRSKIGDSGRSGAAAAKDKADSRFYPHVANPAGMERPHQLMQFQEDAIQRLNNHFAEKKCRPGILCFPTGGGKTKTAVCFLIERCLNRNETVLWIAHRSELLNQAEEAFIGHSHLMSPGRKMVISRYDGDNKDLSGNVILLSKQTFAVDVNDQITIENLMVHNTTGSARIGMVCYDEAHTTVSQKSFRTLKTRFIDREIPLLGLTATPFRATDQGTARLQEVYGKEPIAFQTMKKLIDLKFLARPILHRNHIADHSVKEIDSLSLAEKREIDDRGDFTPKILSRVAASKERNRQIVRYWNDRKVDYGKTLVFACNQKHAENLAHLFGNIPGVQADFVVHTHGRDERKNKLKSFDDAPSSGATVLVNVGILTEGIDIPSIHSVLMARPTLSEPLYLQMVGRGSRGPIVRGGTEEFHIIDGVYNFEKHGLKLAGEFFAREVELKEKSAKTYTIADQIFACADIVTDQEEEVPSLDLDRITIAGVLLWRTPQGLEQSTPIGRDHESIVTEVCANLETYLPDDEGEIRKSGGAIVNSSAINFMVWAGIASDCAQTGQPPRYEKITQQEIVGVAEKLLQRVPKLLQTFRAIAGKDVLVQHFYQSHGWANDEHVTWREFVKLYFEFDRRSREERLLSGEPGESEHVDRPTAEFWGKK